MRSALFLSFLLVFLLAFSTLAARPAVAAPEISAPGQKLGTVAFANSCAPEAQESFASAALRCSTPSRLRRAKRHSARRSTATQPAPSPPGVSRRS